jgi:hypothetical protein
VRLALDLLGARKELFEEGAGKLLALDHMPHSGRDGHEKTSFLDSQIQT